VSVRKFSYHALLTENVAKVGRRIVVAQVEVDSVQSSSILRVKVKDAKVLGNTSRINRLGQDDQVVSVRELALSGH
jgi:hypothetical protein